MGAINFLKNIDLEREKRIKIMQNYVPDDQLKWHEIVNNIKDAQLRSKLLTAFDFAQSIKYNHVGLKSNVYFTHPIRVSYMAMLSQTKEIDILEAGIVGLLHNVFELSNHEIGEIADIVGMNLATQVFDLTVNRELQWDKIYKENYYLKINNNPKSCRIVKILDKLDNIFLLDLNDDQSVKERYLQEIVKYIVPMVKKDMPELFPYFQKLVDFQFYKLNE
uniref:HD domain-containing protein n=1 Tax=Algoriphagus sp. TaxID=1872435 RepID=UPI00404750A5